MRLPRVTRESYQGSGPDLEAQSLIVCREQSSLDLERRCCGVRIVTLGNIMCSESYGPRS